LRVLLAGFEGIIYFTHQEHFNEDRPIVVTDLVLVTVIVITVYTKYDINNCKPAVHWFCLFLRWFLCLSVFLRATAYAVSAHMLSQFHLSVRLSITRVIHAKTVEVRIIQFSPHSSPIPLVFVS